MSDQTIVLRDLLAPSVVSLAAVYQLAGFTRAVGTARGKFKVKPPATDGEEGFVRVFRAQQNSLEFAPLFFPCVWVSSLFFHPVPSVIASFGYMYARGQYFSGYSKSADERVPPFKLSVTFLKALMFMSAAGLVNFSLREYMGVDISGKISDFINQFVQK